MSGDVQTTFADIKNVQHVKALTHNQRMIISLLACGLTQTGIADRLHFSKPYINQVIKKLESLNLVKRIRTQRNQNNKRSYNYFYEVAAETKIPHQPFTICRVHNIKKKFRILSQSGPASTDKRASWTRSWKPRGPERHKFWYPGKAGMPSVTIDVHPKTIVAYIDKGQKIPAKDIAQAKEIAWYALLQAREQFIKQQALFGISFEIESVGEDIAKTHYGFVFDDRSGIAQDHIDLPHWWIDKSPEEYLGPHMREAETDIENEAGALEKGIRQAQAVPAAMKELESKLNPIGEDVSQVKAMLQGGITISAQYEQMINFMTKVMNEMAEMRKENAELKRALNKGN